MLKLSRGESNLLRLSAINGTNLHWPTNFNLLVYIDNKVMYLTCSNSHRGLTPFSEAVGEGNRHDWLLPTLSNILLLFSSLGVRLLAKADGLNTPLWCPGHGKTHTRVQVDIVVREMSWYFINATGGWGNKSTHQQTLI